MAKLLSTAWTEYKPGDVVPTSGIYKVTHDPAHTEEHEVTCVKGKIFPPCRDCHHPRFVLVRTTQHVAIEDHELFKGPALRSPLRSS